MSDSPSPSADLNSDPMLREAPTIEGFKVLQPVALYAKVGDGGIGPVYRGRHCKLDMDVAVKCLRRSLAEDAPEFVTRLEREATLAASLVHQNIVRVLDVYRGHGLHYIVMEFVDGESARDRVARLGKLSEQEALAIVFGAVSGLAEAHARGIVHRDIKPDNMRISVDGRVKLADLGMAKGQSADDESMSVATGLTGRPQFVAPEQLEKGIAGPAGDVWSLGASLFYLLAGKHALDMGSTAGITRLLTQPYPSLREERPGLRDEVYAVIERCVAREPEARFADARALLAALRPLVQIGEAELSTNAPAPSAVESPITRDVLAEIRRAVETSPKTGTERVSDDASELATIVSPGERQAVPETIADGIPATEQSVVVPGTNRTPLLAAAAAVLVLGYGWMDGWFDGPTDPGVSVDIFAARQNYRLGVDLLPQPGKLDEAIDKLKKALELDPELTEAKEPLARALDKKAERVQATDLDAAFLATRQANDLLPDDQVIEPHFERLLGRMRARLVAGLEFETADGFDPKRTRYLVSPTSRFELQGRMTAKNFAKMTLTVPQKMSISRAPLGLMREVQLVAGEFSEGVTVPVGDSVLTVVLDDRLGVKASVAITVRVSGTAGNTADPATATGACPDYQIYDAGGCRMLPISVGAFAMGSEPNSALGAPNETRHQVQLTIPMWVAETEVTRAQWQRVMKTTPWPDDGRALAGDLPATHITRQQAIQFCNRLTELERAAGRLPEGHLYLLPTEAQWEFACRGGSDSVYGMGVSVLNLGQFAVYRSGVEEPKSMLVKSRRANAYGLHDMLGNVAEWCRDLGLRNPLGLINTSVYRDGLQDPFSVTGTQSVYRGGHFASDSLGVRCAVRSGAALMHKSDRIGFRPVLAKPR